MAVGFAFIVEEFCTQSHLSTDDYAAAARGLRRTRWFKKYTYIFRRIPQNLIEFGKLVGNKIFGQRVGRKRRSLVWTWQTKSPAMPVIKIEASTVHGEEECRGQARSLLNDGETNSGDADGETNAPANIPLRKVQSAPIGHIGRSMSRRAQDGWENASASRSTSGDTRTREDSDN